MKKITVPAKLEQLSVITDFVMEELALLNCSDKIQMQIAIAVEEIFVNIANYAYYPDEGDAIVLTEVQESPLRMTITFMDDGIPYNPLARPDSDTSLPVSDREIGGLGIFLVKQNMDFVDYKYENNQNIFTIMKALV